MKKHYKKKEIIKIFLNSSQIRPSFEQHWLKDDTLEAP